MERIVMEQYIPKSILIAEIEKQIEVGKFKCQQSQENNDRESYVAWSEHIATCGKILSFLSTLEVKEEDLEREINDYFITVDLCEGEKITENTFRRIAKHFFELGLKGQKL